MDRAKVIKDRLREGLPRAAFYLALFYAVMLLFNAKYGIIASFTGAAFDFNWKKRLSVPEVAILAILQMVACSFGCLASLNVGLRIACNALFPFIWILLRSSPFNPKGYLMGIITFMLIQLVPFERGEIPYVMGIVAFATLCLAVTLLIMQRFKSEGIEDSIIRQGLREIASLLSSGSNKADMLWDIERSMFKKSYSGHNLMHTYARGEHLYYIFALIFQRAAYYVIDRRNAEINRENVGGQKRLTAFLEHAANAMNRDDNERLIEEARRMFKEGDGLTGHFGALYHNTLRLIILAFKEMTSGTSHKERFRVKRYLQNLRNHLELNSFELRFALRMSIVMTFCLAFMDLINSEHSYWLAANAFVIIQPMYDDSVTRVQARLVGSLVGCLPAYAAYMIMPGMTAMYVFFTAMIICLYMSAPGKWVQSVFATACGVSMASITLGGGAAVGYRLMYLAIAAALVYCVNKFIFPSTKHKRFLFHIQSLYHMQKFYLRVIRQSLDRKISLTMLRNALVNFHMLCDEVREEKSETHANGRQKYLLLLWRMVSEAEQMIVILHTEALSEKDKVNIGKWEKEMYDALEAQEPFSGGDPNPPEVRSEPVFTELAECYQKNLAFVCSICSSFYVTENDIGNSMLVGFSQSSGKIICHLSAHRHNPWRIGRDLSDSAVCRAGAEGISLCDSPFHTLI